jgi:hypothetical protein
MSSERTDPRMLRSSKNALDESEDIDEDSEEDGEGSPKLSTESSPQAQVDCERLSSQRSLGVSSPRRSPVYRSSSSSDALSELSPQLSEAEGDRGIEVLCSSPLEKEEASMLASRWPSRCMGEQSGSGEDARN